MALIPLYRLDYVCTPCWTDSRKPWELRQIWIAWDLLHSVQRSELHSQSPAPAPVSPSGPETQTHWSLSDVSVTFFCVNVSPIQRGAGYKATCHKWTEGPLNTRAHMAVRQDAVATPDHEYGAFCISSPYFSVLCLQLSQSLWCAPLLKAFFRYFLFRYMYILRHMYRYLVSTPLSSLLICLSVLYVTCMFGPRGCYHISLCFIVDGGDDNIALLLILLLLPESRSGW